MRHFYTYIRNVRNDYGSKNMLRRDDGKRVLVSRKQFNELVDSKRVVSKERFNELVDAKINAELR